MFSDHLLFSFSPPYQIYCAIILTHRLLPTLYSPIIQRRLVNYYHHGSCPNMGTGCQEEKTPRIPANGMCSRLGAVRRSATSSYLLLILFSLHPAPLWV